MVRPERPGTVRCDVLFPAIYAAVAEYLAHKAPDRVFRTGEDLVVDAALAHHLAEHGTVTFDQLDAILRSTDDAVLALYSRVIGKDITDIPIQSLDALHTREPIGWFNSLHAPLAGNALLTESGAHYLLDRAGELAGIPA